jgi:hypothetical protein
MQACVTRWFKPMDPSKVGQYHDWLFEKEKSDREKRVAEREARIRAVRSLNMGYNGHFFPPRRKLTLFLVF